MLRAVSAAAKRGSALSRVALPRTGAPALHRCFAAVSFLDEADVTDRVLGCVKSFQKVDPTKVTMKAHFLNDLGLDSLDTVEVVMALEDEFVIEIQDVDAEKIQTCEDAIKYVMMHPSAQ